MTVLPQASGIATARTPRMTGAFHGAMPSTTPAGWRIANATRPGSSEGITSPTICVVRAAASRSICAATLTLNSHQDGVAPTSAIIVSAKSSARPAMRSAAAFNSARRSPGPVDAQTGNARDAASAAATASIMVAAAACVAIFPVSGSRRSNVRPSAADGSRSPIIRLTRNIPASLDPQVAHPATKRNRCRAGTSITTHCRQTRLAPPALTTGAVKVSAQSR